MNRRDIEQPMAIGLIDTRRVPDVDQCERDIRSLAARYGFAMVPTMIHIVESVDFLTVSYDIREAGATAVIMPNPDHVGGPPGVLRIMLAVLDTETDKVLNRGVFFTEDGGQ
ncbi:hypothetical protein [Nocardia sp. CA-290969]|uniref:hypothetical protein n=1 Tax=Nocardia sp. CA-290969 TaxID=3239986 RepID=UPI003D9309F2